VIYNGHIEPPAQRHLASLQASGQNL